MTPDTPELSEVLFVPAMTVGRARRRHPLMLQGTNESGIRQIRYVCGITEYKPSPSTTRLVFLIAPNPTSYFHSEPDE